ncbi:MAG: peptidyl-prolyl cis-trans isomerase [Pseudomonadota bacterium]
MNNTTVFKALFLVCAVAAVCGCKKPEPAGTGSDEEILAEIGDVRITVKEFQDTINAYTPYLRSKYNTPEMKKKKLEEMVRFELLAMEAKSRGYDKDPMVQRALRQSLIRELIQREVEDKVKLEDIDEAQMRKYYEDHPEKYQKPAQRRLAHVLIKDKALAGKVLEEVLGDTKSSVKFRESVMKYSEDPINKSHGGDMGYFSKLEERVKDEPEIDARLLEALYSLENVGDVYGKLVETEEGYHIVKFTSTRPEVHRTFEQVHRQIQSILWKDKREEAKEKFVQSLRQKAKIVINEKLFDQIMIPEPQGPPGINMDADLPPGVEPPGKVGPAPGTTVKQGPPVVPLQPEGGKQEH